MIPSTASRPLPGQTPGGRIADAIWLALCVGLVGWFSLRRGQDQNWDLQNYHFYNPWAWVNGKRGYTYDIVAAQLQTYHSPIPDLPFYGMVAAGWHPKLIAFMLAVPAGVAAFILLKLLNLLFADLPFRERAVAVGVAFVVSATSAMGAGVLGTTMNEWPGAMLTLAGVWVLVRAMVRDADAPLRRGPPIVAGLLCGLATGLKLTFGLFAFALCLALWLRQVRPVATWLRNFREAFLFGIAVLAGTLVSGGAWMWELWTQLGSPVFPYGNEWIRSPWWDVDEVIGRGYGPHSVVEWVQFPFRMLSPRPFFVAETEYFDARFPVLYGLALATLAAWLTQRLRALRVGHAELPAVAGAHTRKAWWLVSLYFVLSFLLWTQQFSIYRYLVPLEMLTGALIVALLMNLLRPGYALPAAVVLAFALVSSTKAPDWGHLEFEDRSTWFDVRVPPVERNALVLLASDGPMGYTLPYFPPDARFFGVNNSINDPQRKNLMTQTIAREIKAHRGPLYSLAYPKGAGVDALLALDLMRIPETCRDVVTTMRTSPVQLCKLLRMLPKSP